jgi:hypothetical protein
MVDFVTFKFHTTIVSGIYSILFCLNLCLPLLRILIVDERNQETWIDATPAMDQIITHLTEIARLVPAQSISVDLIREVYPEGQYI